MPFDGSGNYVPAASPNFPAIAGDEIVAAYYNAVINDIAAGLSVCITRDGQGRPTNAIDWGNQNLTNVSSLGAVSLALSGDLAGVTATFTGAVAINSLTLTTKLGVAYGGTGISSAAAANGQLLIGTGTGFALATITAGAGITVTNAAGTITIAATGGGGSGTTSFPLTANDSGTGAATGATFDGSVAKTISWNTVGAKPALPQIQSVASAATVTPTFSNDQVNITAQAAALAFANPTGTAVDGWGIAVRVKDNGTARAITFGTQYRAVGVILPTTTVASKTMYLGMIYNLADTKWDVVAYVQEA